MSIYVRPHHFGKLDVFQSSITKRYPVTERKKKQKTRDTLHSLAQKIMDDHLLVPEAKVGDKLPLISELGGKYGFSMPTIGKALSLLQLQGYVKGKRGQGVFITTLPQATSSIKGEMTIGFISSFTYSTSHLLGAISQTADFLHVRLRIANSRHCFREEQRQFDKMVGEGVAGVIVQPVLSVREADDYLTRPHPDYPIVTLDAPVPDSRCPSVMFDNWSAGYSITRFLLEKGHRHILFLRLRTPVPHRSIGERLDGFFYAMKENGIPEDQCAVADIFHDETAFPEGTDVYPPILEKNTAKLRAAFAEHPKTTAVILPTDGYAHAFKRHLQKLKLPVSPRMVVVGFDNFQRPEWSEAFLTTNPDWKDMGRRAVNMLLQNIQTPPKTTTELILPCPLYFPPSLDVDALRA